MLTPTSTQDFLDRLDQLGPELEQIEMLPPSPAAAAPAPRTDPRVFTVLVVDDEEDICRLMSRIIGREGHHVLTAGDGETALSILDSRDDIDLVFLDAMMPRLDGLKTVAKVREGGGGELPVVMVSGCTGNKHIVGGYKAGVDYYVTKPFRPRTILNIMRYLLEDLPEEEGLALEKLL